MSSQDENQAKPARVKPKGLVWLAAYPRSGCMWMRCFLESYLKNKGGDIDINALSLVGHEAALKLYSDALSCPFDQAEPEAIAKARPTVQRIAAAQVVDTTGEKGHGFLKTNMAFGEQFGHPIIDPNHTAGAIYLVRHPYDVAVSLAGHLSCDFDRAIDIMSRQDFQTKGTATYMPEIWSSWSLNVLSWVQARQHIPTIILRYEDLVKSPEKAFALTLAFLGIKGEATTLASAIESVDFDKLTAQEAKSGFVEQVGSEAFFARGFIGSGAKLLNQEQKDSIWSSHHQTMEKLGYSR